MKTLCDIFLHNILYEFELLSDKEIYLQATNKKRIGTRTKTFAEMLCPTELYY